MSLPNRLRYWRKKRGLTLRDVAASVGVSHGSVHRMEAGDQPLTVDWMEQIAKYLRVVPADLLTLEMGGLSEEERYAVQTLRIVPDQSRRMIMAMIKSQTEFAWDK